LDDCVNVEASDGVTSIYVPIPRAKSLSLGIIVQDHSMGLLASYTLEIKRVGKALERHQRILSVKRF
jgi:hypothetical protein